MKKKTKLCFSLLDILLTMKKFKQLLCTSVLDYRIYSIQILQSSYGRKKSKIIAIQEENQLRKEHQLNFDK